MKTHDTIKLHGLPDPPRRGHLTFQAPVRGGMTMGDAVAFLGDAVEKVRLAMARAYGVGRYVSPLEQVTNRFVHVEGQQMLEFRVTVETPDDGSLLMREVERQHRLNEWLTVAVLRGPKS